MSTLEEIKNEIIQNRQMVPVDDVKTGTRKPRKAKKQMTKEEIEAYRKKAIEKEEAKYLGESVKKKRRRKIAKDSDPDAQCDGNIRKARRTKKLEPICMLRVPGLPDGDCIAIYYSRWSS